MNALVLKTNTIVNIVRKDKEHYIDDNFNPYTKDELEFFIKQNQEPKRPRLLNDEEQEQGCFGIEFNGQFMSFDELNKLQMANSKMEKVLWLAASVVEQHPDFNPRQVADFCLTIYTIINKNVK